jgi:hypothetical protein
MFSGDVAFKSAHQLDAALARPLKNNMIDPVILGIGRVSGMSLASPGMLVQKSGRSSALTRGRIALIETTVNVSFGGGRLARFHGQIASSAMADPGDSGSLLLDGSKKAVGLLFAGSRKATLFHPIKPVLDALNADLNPDLTPPDPEKARPGQKLLSPRQLCREKADFFFSLPNVVGVGIGFKQVRGLATTETSLVVMVKRKMERTLLREEEIIPRRLDGVTTDVLETGEFEAATGGSWYSNPIDRRARIRPARPGLSIGHYLVSAGTLGAIVYDRDTREPLILSNNHVLANATSGSDSLARPGDPILQPGGSDGGLNPRDIIGRLHRFAPLTFLPRP